MAKFVPYYGGKGGKMSNGAGWGGEPPKKIIKKTAPKIHKTSAKSAAKKLGY